MGSKYTGYNPQTLGDAKDERIADLEIAVRAALSFIQERHSDHNDGHAVMVIAALRGALRTEIGD